MKQDDQQKELDLIDAELIITEWELKNEVLETPCTDRNRCNLGDVAGRSRVDDGGDVRRETGGVDERLSGERGDLRGRGHRLRVMARYHHDA